MSISIIKLRVEEAVVLNVDLLASLFSEFVFSELRTLRGYGYDRLYRVVTYWEGFRITGLLVFLTAGGS